ncbi:uncharacterized protein V1516DRAFT_695280 [Lipomyces oligophaga]|uniref:uncharacterized protein n=1 Tax=Lipomyces oligophaga TaxID=45792 RepID=UPI0034CFADEC
MSRIATDVTNLPNRAIPGQPLCSAREFVAGSGTYVDQKLGPHGTIIASLLGQVTIVRDSKGLGAETSNKNGTERSPERASGALATNAKLPKVSVVRSYRSSDAAYAVPDVDDIVLAKVTRVNPRFATVSILTVGDGNPTEEYGGMIRTSDVRETEPDKVRILSCFQPGDLIRAQVISLGDGTNYYLTTARNDLGVVFARCETSGEPMYPVDWQSMKCPKSGIVEKRKCAKPTP